MIRIENKYLLWNQLKHGKQPHLIPLTENRYLNYYLSREAERKNYEEKKEKQKQEEQIEIDVTKVIEKTFSRLIKTR